MRRKLRIQLEGGQTRRGTGKIGKLSFGQPQLSVKFCEGFDAIAR